MLTWLPVVIYTQDPKKNMMSAMGMGGMGMMGLPGMGMMGGMGGMPSFPNGNAAVAKSAARPPPPGDVEDSGPDPELGVFAGVLASFSMASVQHPLSIHCIDCLTGRNVQSLERGEGHGCLG